MIDFRYHLVSLVSVFLALAVGIVLGAGPLKEPIGNTLTESVEKLRQQKDALHADLATETVAVKHRDDFDTAVTPSLVGGQLVGRSVAIVTLPDSDSDAVQPLVDAITAAGGTVTGRVSLSSGWVDPKQASARATEVSALAAYLPAGTVPNATETSQQLAQLLAGALVSTGAGALGHTTPAGTAVLKSLRSASLIGVKGDVSNLAGAALLIAPGNTEADGNVQPTTSPDVDSSYVSLATAMDTTGGGAVVSGPPSSALGGVLAAIRKDDTAKTEVSTVDNGSTPMGVITAVLALREQLAGGVGAYGNGSGTKVLPVLVAGRTSTPAATAK